MLEQHTCMYVKCTHSKLWLIFSIGRNSKTKTKIRNFRWPPVLGYTLSSKHLTRRIETTNIFRDFYFIREFLFWHSDVRLRLIHYSAHTQRTVNIANERSNWRRKKNQWKSCENDKIIEILFRREWQTEIWPNLRSHSILPCTGRQER